MLTPRQQEVLNLIIQLYGQFEEPIGSKTLLRESYLKVSPATIRNDMVVLEQQGLLMKPHTSSGRIPSIDGYRYYIDGIIHQEDKELPFLDDDANFEELTQAKHYSPLQLTQLCADILVSLTGFTAVVLGQNKESHYFEEFKLVPIDRTRYISILMTDKGNIESEQIELKVSLSKDDITKSVEMINDELKGVVLEDTYQRMKLGIPLLTQRLTGYQLDFSPLIEKSMHHIKGHRYYISGKSNLFDLIDGQTSREALKHLFELIDGSREMYHLLEEQEEGINIMFGYEFLADSLANINLLTGSFVNENQKIILGLLGPTTMSYEKVIALLEVMINKLSIQ
ncbi:heat-inducible transcription repressor HrcA [Ruoffia tabacinasalis]|uniref:Heat-inducible transcription repressor HrcA n=1 Tax=Ruoffia tabacinasalis TaxID=87458 RepID=A0A5R9EGM6_9LACT|nr:heat-inducible transcriptional repressor HrcA [Ruoffia tabacinasalis]TLQ49574.1 heat-inducible transcription repressor HrcA [Ruoffia tabacinasalis]